MIAVNRDDIACFVEALFRYCDNGGHVSLRTFHDDCDGVWEPKGWTAPQITNGRGAVIEAAVALAEAAAQAPVPVVFCPPVATFKSAKAAAEKDIRNGPALSIDCDQNPERAREILENTLGPATVTVASGGVWADPETGETQDKMHLHWRLTEPTRVFADHVKLKEARRLATILVGADGSAVPLVHPLRWPGSLHRKRTPRLARIAVQTENEIDLGDALDRLHEAVAARGKSVNEADYSTHQPSEPEADPLDVVAALAVIPNADLPWDEWNKIGMAAWRATGGSASGLAAFMAWSEKSRKYNEADVRERWRHYRTSPPTHIGAGSLFYMGRQARPGWRKPSDIANDWTAPRSGNPFEDYGNGHSPEGQQADEEEDFSAYDRPPPLWVDEDDWSEADLEPRQWVAQGYTLRGAATLVTGAPSAMKSSLMLAWACAVALEREHGEFIPTAAGSVIVYNVEDDQTEQRRRLSAVLRQFAACPADIAGKVIRTGPSGIGTLFTRDGNGWVAPTRAMSRLRDLIAERRPVMLIADPLAELHNAEENDNTAIRAVIAAFRAVAIEFNLAVILIHHTRKGEPVPGDPDSARGASAIIGAARIVKTLIGMSEQDAEALGVPSDRKTRSKYVRLDDAKQNYAALGGAVWFEKVLHQLDNGETVAAALPWPPPDMWKAIIPSVANAILDDIEAGIDTDKGNRRYSDASKASERSVTIVFNKHVPALTERQARAIVKVWIEKGILGRETYTDPTDRRERSGLVVWKRPGPVD